MVIRCLIFFILFLRIREFGRPMDSLNHDIDALQLYNEVMLTLIHSSLKLFVTSFILRSLLQP